MPRAMRLRLCALLGTLTSGDDAPRRNWCGGTANDGIAPAAGFTMVYAQAHYAPGFGERYTQSTPLTTLEEAQTRVRHYSDPILKLGGTFLESRDDDYDFLMIVRAVRPPNAATSD